MIQTNLRKSPQYIEKTKELIERSFGYTPDQSFAVDFYPLFNAENFEHCHILIDNEQVVAHIGVKRRNLAGHHLNMYGGIALASEYRGKGLFKKFFNSLLAANANCALHLLWSDKLDLYNKFGFYPAGELHQYTQKISPHKFDVEKINWKTFHSSALYSNCDELRISRSKNHWNELSSISSADIYLIKKKNMIINYFIMNKGADLTGIIHEYGQIDKEQLNCMRNYGIVWSPQVLDENQSLFSTVVRPGNQNQFQDFVETISGLKVDQLTSELIKFQFNNKQVQLHPADFLIGILGPNRFEELSKQRPIFISGLDSI